MASLGAVVAILPETDQMGKTPCGQLATIGNVMRRTIAGVLTAAVVLGGGLISPASAVDPIDIKQAITDEHDVLGDRRDDVQKAIEQFYNQTGYQLYVVYVPSFGEGGAQEWAEKTADKSDLGKHTVLLTFSTKDRAFGHVTANPDLTPANLLMVDRTKIVPALSDSDYPKATIGAINAYGDLATEDPLPWGWIVTAILLALLVLLIFVRRSRTRFEHTHHVLDEHGNPVDPATILTLDEINTASAAALMGVDDALLTSAADVARAGDQLGEVAVQAYAATVAEGRAALQEAFRLRHKLDKLIAKGDLDDESERKWRNRAARILSICEEVDTALDAHVNAFDEARDLKHRADALLDALAPQVDAGFNRMHGAGDSADAELADNLLRASAAQLEKRNHEPATRVRAIEDAVAAASQLLDSHPDDGLAAAVAAAETFVETRRGAVGVRARTYRSVARRHFEAALAGDDPELIEASRTRAAKFAQLALVTATEDVAQWQSARAAHDERHGRKFDALVLAGILVDETRGGGLGSWLGGSSHGGGSGAPYRGIENGGTLRTAGSFGGSTTRGRRRGF